jgi:hypothetical protein
MRLSGRLMVYSITLFALFSELFLASTAFAWTLRMAPLNQPTVDSVALPSWTSSPVNPQLFRISLTRDQGIIGIEAPYIRVVEMVPPIQFNRISPDASQPVQSAQTSPLRYDLRGPEVLLLRRQQTAVGNTF